jgi:hypothetical protein
MKNLKKIGVIGTIYPKIEEGNIFEGMKDDNIMITKLGLNYPKLLKVIL